MTVQEALSLAVQYHQAGQFTDAEKTYRQILTAQPGHVDALQLLGLLAHQLGRNEAAIDLMQRALAIQPGHHIALANLGEVYRVTGKMSEAVECYRRALQMEPANALTIYNLGNALAEMGNLGEAVATYRRAAELLPESADLRNNLGIALARLGRKEEAVEALSCATRLSPGHGDAQHNFGVGLAALGRWKEAVTASRRALELQPGRYEAWNNLGNVWRELGRFADAEAAYRQALRICEEYADAHANLGIVLFKLGQPEQGTAACRRAIQLQPGHTEALNNLGIILTELGRLDEAAAVLKELLGRHPGDVEAQCNFGNVLKEQGDVDGAMAAYRHALEHKPDDATARSNLIYTMLFAPDLNEAAIAAAHREWAQHIAEPLKRFHKGHENDRTPDRRLRIGYVSADFRNHVIGRNLLPLFRNHEQEQFEVYCYSAVARPDAFTEEFRRRAGHWREIFGVGDAELSEWIRRDGIDILVDLAQHTAGNRLPVFERRPAPVQVSFAGYPESAGVESIRWRISDRHLEKDNVASSEITEGNGERVCPLESFWCYDSGNCELQTCPPPVLANGYPTFGSLNNFCKTNEAVLKLWAGVLSMVQDSRLVLMSAQGSHRTRTLELMGREGISAERVSFVVPRSREAYLQLYRDLDIVLDPFPYNGHTTSLDALWMGVPVVSRVGERAVSRAGFSQLANIGLPELTAFSDEDYTRIAGRLAGDFSRLEELRRKMRERMRSSILMNARLFARGIESAYRQMWQGWCHQ